MWDRSTTALFIFILRSPGEKLLIWDLPTTYAVMTRPYRMESLCANIDWNCGQFAQAQSFLAGQHSLKATMQLTCNNTTYLKGNVNATAQALLLFTVDFRKLILKWAVDHWLFCTHQGYNIKTSNVIVLLESCQFISFLFWIQCSYKMAFCTLCTLSLRWIFAFPVYIHIGKTKVSR